MKVKVLEVDRQGRDHLSIKKTNLHRTAKLRFGYSSLICYLLAMYETPAAE